MATTPATAGNGLLQSPPASKDWSIEALRAAIEGGTLEERLERLKRAGILTADGEIAPLYQNWDKKISRAAPDGYGAPEDEPGTKPRASVRKRPTRDAVRAKKSSKKQ